MKIMQKLLDKTWDLKWCKTDGLKASATVGKKEAAALKSLQNKGVIESQLHLMLYSAFRYDSSHRNDNPNIVICMSYFLDAAQYQVGIRKTDCQQQEQKNAGSPPLHRCLKLNHLHFHWSQVMVNIIWAKNAHLVEVEKIIYIHILAVAFIQSDL